MRIRLNRSYTAKEIATVTGGHTDAGCMVDHLTTDSREVREGDLFVALRGEHADGNAYLSKAMASGASLLLCEGQDDFPSGCIAVPDAWAALAALAKHARDEIRPTVIAITGSTGKTTTKNMVSAVLESSFQTHKTACNQNNLLGLCLTLLSMPPKTEMLVVEMGMNHAGEIAMLSRLASPDVAVITNVGHAHVGNLGSRERIADAKCEIFLGCAPGALCLFPADEKLIEERLPRGLTAMRTGESEACDCSFKNLTLGGNTTVADFTCHAVRHAAVSLPGCGRHLAQDATYAIAIGQTFGVPQAKIRRALATVQNDGMRQELMRKNGITVIVDCYNASPESMRAAADTLMSMAKEKNGRSLALLGDMLELGEETRLLHEQVGEYYAKSGVSFLFTLGAAAENIATGARRQGLAGSRIFSNPDPTDKQASAAQINRILRPRDVLLIKASRALAAEEILYLLETDTPRTEEAKP